MSAATPRCMKGDGCRQGVGFKVHGADCPKSKKLTRDRSTPEKDAWWQSVEEASAEVHEAEKRRVNDARTRAIGRAETNSEGMPRSSSYYDTLRREAAKMRTMRGTLERLWTLAQFAGDSDEDARHLLAAFDELAPESLDRAERLLKAARHG